MSVMYFFFTAPILRFLISIGAAKAVDEDALDDAQLYNQINCMGAIFWCSYTCIRHWAQGMQATASACSSSLKSQEMDGQMCAGWLNVAFSFVAYYVLLNGSPYVGIPAFGFAGMRLCDQPIHCKFIALLPGAALATTLSGLFEVVVFYIWTYVIKKAHLKHQTWDG